MIDEFAKNVPVSVNEFHTLYPLDSLQKLTQKNTYSKILKTSSEVYKAIDSTKAIAVTLRRIPIPQNFDIASAHETVEVWRNIVHPNICSILKVFVTDEFNSKNG